MKAIADCHLYGILDLGYVKLDRSVEMADRMIAGGVDVLQLRAKNHDEKEIFRLAKELVPITNAAGIPLIINDFPAVAAAVSADGVHLGQEDTAPAPARMLAGKNAIIGRSTHSLKQALNAATEGADYIGFGPIFATPTKPDYPAIGLNDISRVHELVRLPIFCIGGIKLENLEDVLTAGARRVVVVSGILQARDVAGYIREIRTRL